MVRYKKIGKKDELKHDAELKHQLTSVYVELSALIKKLPSQSEFKFKKDKQSYSYD